jgi:hypothetical protein
MPMGKDIGFLPGTLMEKLDPYMQPIYDNLELLMMTSGKKKTNMKFEDLYKQDLIKVEPLTYIRGRSIPNQFLIVDECFPYDTPITTEVGKRKIGSLFSDWIKGNPLPRVKSLDEESKTFVWKPITNMFYQGKRNLVEVIASNRKIKCTPNHPFLTQRGWVKAEELTITDFLLADHPEEIQISKNLNSDLEQIVLGSYLGDGSFEMIRSRTARLSVSHGLKQSEYCTWKANMMGCSTSLVKNSGYNPEDDKIRFTTKCFATNGEFDKPKTKCPQWVLDSLNARGLAIWFMDDGSAYTDYNGARIHTESFDEESVNRMIKKLSEFGISSKLKNYKGNVIVIDKCGYLKLCSIICKYFHSSMQYKIHPDYHNNDYNWNSISSEFGWVQVTEINDIKLIDHVFDIEVQDTHNFIIPSRSGGKLGGFGGVVVHNCQNLSPHELKTIITRCGDGTKIVLTGDPDQIDNPYMDKGSCGLSFAIEKLHNNPIVGHLILSKGERSELANLAATMM